MTRFVLALLLATPAFPAAARDVPPPPSTYVLDEAGWLPPAEEARLSRDLLDYERETSNQIVVAIFRSLDGEDLADFSQRVAEGWGIGREGRDNGILLAIYVEERQVDIEVGYGLEPVVTDAIAHEVRTQILVPELRAGRRAEGILAAVDALKAAARGEFEGTGRAVSDDAPRRRFPPLVVFLVLLVLFILIARASQRGSVLGPPGWGPGGRGVRTFRRGGFGGFGGMGGGGGGLPGGGFRGGGGSFGGGGARGGW